jgi:hypothetical protein
MNAINSTERKMALTSLNQVKAEILKHLEEVYPASKLKSIKTDDLRDIQKLVGIIFQKEQFVFSLSNAKDYLYHFDDGSFSKSLKIAQENEIHFTENVSESNKITILAQLLHTEYIWSKFREISHILERLCKEYDEAITLYVRTA